MFFEIQISVTEYLKIQSISHRKHSVFMAKTSLLMLFRNITAACYDNHMKRINTLFGKR
jgi:hypothetical protein